MGEQMTTAERIEKQLNDIHDTYPGSVYDCFRVIAKEIAAEIDALRDELAVILRERNDAHLALAERTRERDEARAHNAELSTELAGANFEGNLAMIQRDEARAIDWRNMPPRQPHAQPVANLAGLICGALQASGRAYWLQAAGGMVCWVIVCQVGAQTLQVYGAGGPAESLPAAHQIGQDGLRAALDRLATSANVAAAMAQLAANGGAR